MDFTLPEHLPGLLAEMDEFIEAEIKPLEREHIQFFDHRRENARTDWDNGGIPRREWEDLLGEMRRRADKAGWLRYGLPSQFGGRDGTNVDMAVIREHLAHKGLGLHNDLQDESSIVGNFPQVIMMDRFGTDAQKKEWTEALITGERSMAFGLTEPNHGSDATWLETRAERDGDGWVINGAKRFNTGVHRATHDLVFARTSGEPGQARGISAFLVPTDTPGFTVPYYWWTFNMPTDHGEVELNDVRVPDDAVLGEVDRGLEVGQTFLHENRIRQAASSLGAAQYCIDRAVTTPASARCSASRCRSIRPSSGRWSNCRPRRRWCGCWCTTRPGIWTATTTWRCPTRCRWPTTAPTGWCARPPTAPCRSSAASATAATSRSNTSTAITVATASPRARRRSRSAGLRSGCSSLARSDPSVNDAPQLLDRLPAVLRPVLGVEVAVDNLRALTGGASRSTWAFDAVTGGDRRSLILRIGPPDDVHAGMELEARVQAAAAAAGTPVPPVLIADDSLAALGNPFLICEEIKGETIVRRIQRQLDERGPQAPATPVRAALAAIHRADSGDPGLAHEDQLAQWRERLDAMGDTTATFEWGFRWLAAHRPRAVAGGSGAR